MSDIQNNDFKNWVKSYTSGKGYGMSNEKTKNNYFWWEEDGHKRAMETNPPTGGNLGSDETTLYEKYYRLVWGKEYHASDEIEETDNFSQFFPEYDFGSLNMLGGGDVEGTLYDKGLLINHSSKRGGYALIYRVGENKRNVVGYYDYEKGVAHYGC